MDPLQLRRLKEVYQKGLFDCEEKIKNWKKFKSDYEALKTRLETLPDCLSYDITVPFGNHAFAKGKLVHTNEVMVLLGENWFAEVSAKQASNIAARRISRCIEMLEGFQKEKEQFENWLKCIDEVSEKDGVIDIVEEYDEEKEKEWREQHAKNVKSYRQQLAEKKKRNNSCSSDEDFSSRLEKLELAESNGVDISEDEDVNQLDSEPKEIESGEPVECSDDGSHSEQSDVIEKPSLKLSFNEMIYNQMRKTSESEVGDDLEDGNKSDVNANDGDIISPKNGKHVRWQDLSRINNKKITFKHSKPKKQNNSKNKVTNHSENENHPLIQSPSDIYKHFGNYFHSSPPKSILKVKTPSPTTDICEPIFPIKENLTKESSPETDENSISQPFTGEIRERSSPINIVETKSSRPTSHFKCSRKNRKR